MQEFWHSRRTIRYIFLELLPSFFMGVLIFVFIILMFQSFRLMEYVIVHGAKTETVLSILGFLVVSFLPIVLPVSLLFSILLTYGRLSADSEVVALQSLGISPRPISVPAFILAGLTFLLSVQIGFYLAPWGNRQMEILIHRLGESKPGVSIREGVFSEGFFNLVVYANKVNSKTGALKKIFIYDERDAKSPLTIIAREGFLLKDEGNKGQKAFLRLIDGNIHRTKADVYTKVDFEKYDISLFDSVRYTQKKKTNLSYNLNDILKALDDPKLPVKKRKGLQIELHRRWAISAACFIFALLGVILGTNANRRAGKSNGFVLSIGVIVVYWILYAAFENFARNGTLPVSLAIWSVNGVFLAAGLWLAKRRQ